MRKSSKTMSLILVSSGMILQGCTQKQPQPEVADQIEIDQLLNQKEGGNQAANPNATTTSTSNSSHRNYGSPIMFFPIFSSGNSVRSSSGFSSGQSTTAPSSSHAITSGGSTSHPSAGVNTGSSTHSTSSHTTVSRGGFGGHSSASS